MKISPSWNNFFLGGGGGESCHQPVGVTSLSNSETSSKFLSHADAVTQAGLLYRALHRHLGCSLTPAVARYQEDFQILCLHFDSYLKTNISIFWIIWMTRLALTVTLGHGFVCVSQQHWHEVLLQRLSQMKEKTDVETVI